MKSMKATSSSSTRGNSLSFTISSETYHEQNASQSEKENIDCNQGSRRNEHYFDLNRSSFTKNGHLQSQQKQIPVLKTNTCKPNGMNQTVIELSRILRDSYRSNEASNSSMVVDSAKNGSSSVKSRSLLRGDAAAALNSSAALESAIRFEGRNSSHSKCAAEAQIENQTNNKSEIIDMYQALKEEFQLQALKLAEAQHECTRAIDESSISSAKVSELTKLIADQQEEIARLRSVSEVHSGHNEVLRSYIKEHEERLLSQQSSNESRVQDSQTSRSNGSTGNPSQLSRQQESENQKVMTQKLIDQNSQLTDLNQELQNHLGNLKSNYRQLQGERERLIRKLKQFELEQAQMCINASLSNKTHQCLVAEYQVQQMTNEQLNKEINGLRLEVDRLKRVVVEQSQASEIAVAAATQRQSAKYDTQQLLRVQDELRTQIADMNESLKRAETAWRSQKHTFKKEISWLNDELQRVQAHSATTIEHLQQALMKATKVSIVQTQSMMMESVDNAGEEIITDSEDINAQQEPSQQTDQNTQQTQQCDQNATSEMQERINRLEATIALLQQEAQSNAYRNTSNLPDQSTVSPNNKQEQQQQQTQYEQDNEIQQHPQLQQQHSSGAPVYQNNFFYNPFDASTLNGSFGSNMLNFTRDSERKGHNNNNQNGNYVQSIQPNYSSGSMQSTQPVRSISSNQSITSRATDIVPMLTPKGYGGMLMQVSQFSVEQQPSSSQQQQQQQQSYHVRKPSRQAQMDNLMHIYEQIKRRTTPTSR